MKATIATLSFCLIGALVATWLLGDMIVDAPYGWIPGGIIAAAWLVTVVAFGYTIKDWRQLRQQRAQQQRQVFDSERDHEWNKDL